MAIPNTDRRLKALAVFAEAQRGASEVVTDVDGQFLAALREHFADMRVADSPTDDELVESAYELLAADPQHGPAIRALSEGPQSQQYSTALTTIAVGTVALIALQSHFKFERTSTGKWRILVEKKPTSERLLTLLISKLMGRLTLDLGGDEPDERDDDSDDGEARDDG